MKVTPTSNSSASSKRYVDQKAASKADKSDLNQYLKLDGTKRMSGDLHMNGKRVVGLTNIPAYNGEATNKRYVDNKLNDKANKSDLNNYLKLDGTDQMQGNLQMNNNRITNLSDPQLDDEPVTKQFPTITNTFFTMSF